MEKINCWKDEVMEGLTLFQLMDTKMAYISERQNVLSQNIANADTPGYRAKDVDAPDFKQILMRASDGGGVEGGLAKANGGNSIQMEGLTKSGFHVRENAEYEVKPSGNSVDLEEQMLKASRNTMDANMVVNMYIKQMGMIRIAVQGR